MTVELKARTSSGFQGAELRRYHSGGWHPAETYLWNGQRWEWGNFSNAATFQGLHLNSAGTDWDYPQTIATGLGDGLAVADDNNIYYIDNSGTRSIVTYSRTTATEVRRDTIAINPKAMCLNSEGHLVTLNRIPNTYIWWLAIVNLADGSQVDSLNLGDLRGIPWENEDRPASLSMTDTGAVVAYQPQTLTEFGTVTYLNVVRLEFDLSGSLASTGGVLGTMSLPVVHLVVHGGQDYLLYASTRTRGYVVENGDLGDSGTTMVALSATGSFRRIVNASAWGNRIYYNVAGVGLYEAYRADD